MLFTEQIIIQLSNSEPALNAVYCFRERSVGGVIVDIGELEGYFFVLTGQIRLTLGPEVVRVVFSLD